MAPRVRVALNSILPQPYVRKFWELVEKLRSGRFDLKGLRVEKLHTRKGKVYSARVNVEIRVIFSMFCRGDKRSLVIWDANHHDDAYCRVDRISIPAHLSGGDETLEPVEAWGAGAKPLGELDSETRVVDNESLTDGLLLFEVPHFVLVEPAKFSSFEKNIDRYLRLTEEQERLISKTDKAFVVRGSAGTGKTTLALFHALNLYEHNPDDDIFFFTYQDELACVCRCYKVNLVGDSQELEKEDSGGLRVFSYLQFCRDYLRRNLDKRSPSWQWIDREASLKLIEEIVQSKSRWTRTVDAEDTYSYIYSILKGRFIPGSDKFPQSDDDYRRIFKGYGTSPKNLDEIMEIFQLYESRLARANQRDEADLIRYCYQNMKDTAFLSGERRATWIVIDEIQDFTELEWKSILLFWENKCKSNKERLSFPFLSGDRHQNISRSGFRWQEVDSYIEEILKTMHRPKAMMKVQLHNNFRNTLEIFNISKFIRECAPEGTVDLGLPPQFSLRKPTIVIGSESNFLQFLNEVGGRGDVALPAPLVVLFESESDLKSVRRQLPLDDGLFLMPLRRSKGMEFEDCILYRLFSSLSELDDTSGEDLIARMFDLWYMGVTRARKNLLIYLTDEDWSRLQLFLGSKIQALLELIDLRRDQAPKALNEFYEASEKYVPNYNVIFLERVKAQESWGEWQRTSDDKEFELSDQDRIALKEQALRLWKKCRDWVSLGQAFKSLKQYSDAVPYLKLANLAGEVAFCLEQVGRYAEAAQYYEENHALAEAARCFELAGQNLRAAELYAVVQDWRSAAENFAKCGDTAQAAACYERAESWSLAADLFKLKGQWLKAAELYRHCSQFDQAAEMYLKVKDKLDAARCFMSARQPAKAAKLLESLNRWSEAAECYEQAESFEKARALYAKAGRLKEVAQCAERSGDLQTAAAAYERMKSWPKAGEIYLKLENKQKAADCFENAQDWIKALPLLLELEDWGRLGRCCERLGDLPRAVEYYLRVNGLSEAAYCFEKGEQWNQAADYYLKAGNYSAAAAMLAKLNRKVDAARLYLLDNQTAPALELVRSVLKSDPSSGGKQGDLRLDLALWAEQKERPDLAAAVYEQMGHFMLAGHRFKQAMIMGKAADCFEKDHKLALAAELYQLDGQLQKAGQCYKQVRQWQRAGQCFEKAKDWSDAIEMYSLCEDVEGIKRCQSSLKWL
jgi:superfamily I DNA/RNA helicase/Txe/YoeB family toxin of Txe-Axe toxin-antitoxin module